VSHRLQGERVISRDIEVFSSNGGRPAKGEVGAVAGEAARFWDGMGHVRLAFTRLALHRAHPERLFW